MAINKIWKEKNSSHLLEPCKFRIFQKKKVKSLNLWQQIFFRSFATIRNFTQKMKALSDMSWLGGDMWMGWKTRCRWISNKEFMHIRITQQMDISFLLKIKGSWVTFFSLEKGLLYKAKALSLRNWRPQCLYFVLSFVLVMLPQCFMHFGYFLVPLSFLHSIERFQFRGLCPSFLILRS